MTKPYKFGKFFAPPAMFKAPRAESPAIAELLQMHTYGRPAESDMERRFCARYLDHLPGVSIDLAGNRILRVGEAHKVLWSSHTDTVHRVGERVKIVYGAGILSLAGGEKASCLGADCTVGVWLMVQMIRRKIPGLYIFHAAEEVGGIGSRYIAKKTPELLDGIDCAIALDRRGTDSVITYQSGGDCCSNTFAEALSENLGGLFAPDSGGTFTDTANYTSLVSECTNLSVGYYGAHTPGETLDVSFAAHLLESLCALDVSKLPIVRDPSADSYGGWGEYDDWARDGGGYRNYDIRDLTYENPGVAADFLEEMGITLDQFEARIRKYKRN